MPLLRTLVLTPNFDVVRESVTFTNVSPFDSGGLASVFNKAQRPVYKFTLNLEPMYRGAFQNLAAFHAFHQGAKTFMFDGGPYATVQDFTLFGEGDGNRRQFYLPNRYIGAVQSGGGIFFASSYQLQTVNQVTGTSSTWLTTAYSVNPAIGLVTFTPNSASTPSSGHDILAKYACNYRCRFEGDGLRMIEFRQNIYKCELKLEEVILFT